MYKETVNYLENKFPGYKLCTIISRNLVSNFTEESIIDYLRKTYNVHIPDRTIHGDPSWYGRGSVLLSSEDAKRIPSNWESKLSKCYDELECLGELVC